MTDRTMQTPTSGALEGDEQPPERVVYLLGAGATQGCVSYLGQEHKLGMKDLVHEIDERLHQLASESFPQDAGVQDLVNDIVDLDLDIEHLATFLQDSPSKTYRELSSHLQVVFAEVLASRLERAQRELGPDHSWLYAVLLDMHNTRAINETLSGFLTLNYDLFLEHAIQHHLRGMVDYGLTMGVEGASSSADSSPTSNPVRVLKLHGSFGWSQEWPIRVSTNHDLGVWIPPGVRKLKADYPFNSVWGMARELLDCDVVRIIGCNLSAKDWDLVSLLFGTRLTHSTSRRYRVEVISDLKTACRIKEQFPYLEILTLLDLPRIGEQLVGEILGKPKSFAKLTDPDRQTVLEHVDQYLKNPFHDWLRFKRDLLMEDLDDLETERGVFKRFSDSGR